MARDHASWLVVLREAHPALDPMLLRLLAGLLARTELPADALLIAADAVGEAIEDDVAMDFRPHSLRSLRNLLIREANARRGSFW